MDGIEEVVVDGKRVSLDDAFAMAAARCQSGDIKGGEAVYQLIRQAHPDNARAIHALGFIAGHFNRTDDAIVLMRKAIALRPDYTDAYLNLGSFYFRKDRVDEAVEAFRKAVELAPGLALAQGNLGVALKKQGKSSEAEEALRLAITADPQYARGHAVLAALLHEQCRLGEALEHFRVSLRIKPDPLIHSDFLLVMNYLPSVTVGDLYQESLVWDERYGKPRASACAPLRNNPDPDRRLRIGYVSADFRRHPVGYFLMPVLAAHDRSQVEIYCYSETVEEDDFSTRLRSHAGVWRSTVDLSDEELVGRIREDGIDLLIDLSGHTKGNRLTVFAARPAPVLATWAGYVGTTGLSAMDYLISDWRETPEGSDHWYVEKVERLPDGYVCYEPPAHAPPVAPLPAFRRGGITFGCFNNLAKIHPGVIALWSRILKQVPGSRMLMVTSALGDSVTQEKYRAMFREAGFSGDIDFLGKQPHSGLLALYNEVDIALDPFPYSGGLTTLESLWMGVPVVTLGGDRFCARHSVSHLATVGMTELIADGPEGYVDISVKLALDLTKIETIRRELRPKMAASPICNGTVFTRNLEALFRKMWRRWALNAVQILHA